MAKMIIRQSQLKAINESATAFAYNGDKPNGFQTEYTNFITKNPAATGSTIQAVNTSDNATAPATTEPENAQKSKQVIIPADTNNTSTLGESRYTKRQIELARLLEMRKNGKVYSKKQLNEMFMETQENAERLRDGIGDCDIFQVIDAVDEFFPEESENFKEALHNGADLAEYLCSIFSDGKVDANKEEEFLDSLGL
jgi:hypothetical protein